MGEIFEQVLPDVPLEWNGERLTTAAGGQVEIEHLHRYIFARDFCRGLDILDVASGEGYGTALLAQVARSTTGVEVSAEVVGHAARNYRAPGLRFLNGDARSLPLRDASVDVVVSFETIEHFYEHDVFLAEVRRVLRPRGQFIVSSPDRDNYSSAGSTANPFHARELSRAEFDVALRASFAHVHMLAQRCMLGSVLMNDGAGSGPAVTIERRGPHHFERSDALSRPVYLLAVASNAEMSPLPNSVFIDTGEIGPVMSKAASFDPLNARLTETLRRAEAAETVFQARQREIERVTQDAHATQASREEIEQATQNAHAATTARTRELEARLQSADLERELETARADARTDAEKEALAEMAAQLDDMRAALTEATSRADALRTEVREACAMRDAARLALRRAASLVDEGWSARQARDSERRAAEGQESCNAERDRVRQLANRSGLLGLWRTMPLPVRRVIRNHLFPSGLL